MNSPIKLRKSHFCQIVHIDTLEEFYHFLSLLPEAEVEELLKKFHTKELAPFASPHINALLKKSKTMSQLSANLKHELADKLHAEYLALLKSLASLEKKGVDIYIEKLKLSTVPHKIHLFRIAFDKKDFYAAKKIFHEIGTFVSEKTSK